MAESVPRLGPARMEVGHVFSVLCDCGNQINCVTRDEARDAGWIRFAGAKTVASLWRCPNCKPRGVLDV